MILLTTHCVENVHKKVQLTTFDCFLHKNTILFLLLIACGKYSNQKVFVRNGIAKGNEKKIQLKTSKGAIHKPKFVFKVLTTKL